MGDGHNTSSPLYHPAVSPGRDDRLHALADNVQRARKTKWVRENTAAHPDRLALWSGASGHARTALESKWEAEDAADEAEKKKAAEAEADRRRRVVESRARLRG
jgi:hypothetical protein